MNKRIIAITACWLMLCGFMSTQSDGSNYSQPPEERKAQDALPKSHDPVWKILGTTKITVNEKKGLYSATYPPAVKQLVGKPLTVKGFMLPLDADDKTSHFILSKRTPTCPFCPPGEPNEIIEIYMDKPIAWEENLVTITGIFGFVNKQELGMFFVMKHAKKS